MAYLIDRFSRDLLDAAGSQPTSLKVVTGDYVQDLDDLPLLIDRVNFGGATQVWSLGEVAMTVPAVNGAYAIAQTKLSHPYLSGHPNLLTVTFGNMAFQANVIKRVLVGRSDTVAPYDTGYDGCMFESNGVTNQRRLVLWKNGVQRAELLQSQWEDKLDGTGPSGFNMSDWNDFIVMAFDYLYLGGTWMRVGVNVGGQIIYFARFKNSGYENGTFVRTPRFHIRWEIRSVGGAGSMQQICASHVIQGNKETIGKEFGLDSSGTTVTCQNTNTEYLLAAFRLRSGYLPSYVLPKNISVFSGSATNGFIYRLRMNPTIANFGAPSWISAAPHSLEYAQGNTTGLNTVTATVPPLHADLGVSRANNLSNDGSFTNVLGSKIDGTADILALTVQPLQGNMVFYWSSTFSQL